MASQQAVDVLTCIETFGPITAEGITHRTDWNRHVVDLCITALVREGWIYQSGVTDDEWRDPMYKSIFIANPPKEEQPA